MNAASVASSVTEVVAFAVFFCVAACVDVFRELCVQLSKRKCNSPPYCLHAHAILICEVRLIYICYANVILQDLHGSRARPSMCCCAGLQLSWISIVYSYNIYIYIILF